MRRTCPCGAQATNRKGPARCEPCRRERVRLAEQRYHDKSRGSYQRGWDEPRCVWCDTEMVNQRPYEVLRPNRFCSTRCRGQYGNEQRRARVLRERRCRCGALPTNRKGLPNCADCRRRSKERQARARSLRPYGISIDDYERILAEQRGGCAICHSETPGRGQVFCVDHCHVSGQVRGLLCLRCNTAIGMLQDSPRIAEAATWYLKRTRQLRLII